MTMSSTSKMDSSTPDFLERAASSSLETGTGAGFSLAGLGLMDQGALNFQERATRGGFGTGTGAGFSPVCCGSSGTDAGAGFSLAGFSLAGLGRACQDASGFRELAARVGFGT